MIAAHQRDGDASGVNLSCDKPCVVLTGSYWRAILSEVKDSIVFIDEGEQFVTTDEFSRAVQASDNYYVIATRSSLFNLTYSTKEVYGIENRRFLCLCITILAPVSRESAPPAFTSHSASVSAYTHRAVRFPSTFGAYRPSHRRLPQCPALQVFRRIAG